MKFESTGFPKLGIKGKNQELDYYQGIENRLQFSRLKKMAQKYFQSEEIQYRDHLSGSIF